MNGLGLICVAGVIGVGKTTLARRLAAELGARLIDEEYDRNPFLAAMLTGDRTAALPCELDFLLSRARQLHRGALAGVATAVCDYVFEKNRLFARRNLTAEQFAAFELVERAILPQVTPPSRVIYLRDAPEDCRARIVRRGRPYEQQITPAFLVRMQAEYDELFDRWDRCPVLRVDGGRHDVRETRTVRLLMDWLKEAAAEARLPAC